jgi:endonuclease G
MDYRHLFSDKAIADEFMDRLEELTGASAGGLESLGSAEYGRGEVEKAVRGMQEGTGAPIDSGLEAIILRFTRPAYFVQKDTFDTEGTPSSSAEVDGRVNGARSPIEAAIPSVGRVNLRNHRMRWVGTGWVVAPNVVVTNRHVAKLFAEARDGGFAFVESSDGRTARASLDMYREHQEPTESVFRMREVLWIEPERSGHHDAAFLSMDEENEDDGPQPSPIALASEQEFGALKVGHWAAVIGYPAFSIYNDRQDQQRIFEGVFDVKRMQPGLLTAIRNDGIVEHDATTLGGNSGSAVVDLETGKAVALHYGGLEGDTNFAVAAPIVSRLLREKAG